MRKRLAKKIFKKSVVHVFAPVKDGVKPLVVVLANSYGVKRQYKAIKCYIKFFKERIAYE